MNLMPEMTDQELPDWTGGVPRLVVELCRTCGHSWYFPRRQCPRCGTEGPLRRESAGTGLTVAATTVAGSAASGEDGCVAIVLVDLDEGVRVMGRADPTVVPGDRVRVGFPTTPPLPHFSTMEGGS